MDEPAAAATDLERVLEQILDAPEAERAARIQSWMDEHPSRAAELREALDRLAAVGIDLSTPAGEEQLPERLGDFRLIELLGRGGMGVVYRAQQESLDREVALKLVRPELLWFPRTRERFRREIETVARLQHPGIVPVHLVGEESGLPYFAMELVRGCTLAHALKTLADRDPATLHGEDAAAVIVEAAGGEVLSPEAERLHTGVWWKWCATLATKIAEALEHAHRHGVVHRDVKPSNIALSTDGRVMLLDFGLTATRSDGQRLTQTSSLLGTLPYMAPEQLRGRAFVGPGADVYSLGVTLFEMLTLGLPFPGEDETALRSQIESGPPLLSRRYRGVPNDLQTIVTVAMDVDPEHRYLGAASMARDLEHVVARRPIEAHPPSFGLRTRRFFQRHPAVGVAMALAVLLVAGLPAALWWQQREHNQGLQQVNQDLDRANAQANERAEAGTALSTALMQLLRSAAPEEAHGEPRTVEEVLDAEVEQVYESLESHPFVFGTFLVDLSHTYSSLGRHETALRLARDALTKIETCCENRELAHAWPDRVLCQHRAKALYNLARVCFRAKDVDSMLPLIEQLRELEESLEFDVPEHFLANVTMERANLLVELGRWQEGAEAYREALEVMDRVGGEAERAIARSNFAHSIHRTEPGLAEQLFEEALGLSRNVALESPDVPFAVLPDVRSILRRPGR